MALLPPYPGSNGHVDRHFLENVKERTVGTFVRYYPYVTFYLKCISKALKGVTLQIFITEQPSWYVTWIWRIFSENIRSDIFRAFDQKKKKLYITNHD